MGVIHEMSSFGHPTMHPYADKNDPSSPKLVFLRGSDTESIKDTSVEDVPSREVWGSHDEDGAFDAIVDDDWSDLSPEAKEAALTLGYTEAIWDNAGHNNLIDNKDWKDLSSEQMAAAEVLGYNQIAWDHSFI
eukprot:scaffold221057_cov45-Attheya_sp.AAC.2